MVDIRSLSYFTEIAQVQHVTKAAENLRIAQPSLSRTIARLEKELGVKLFDRKGKNIFLNDYGEILLKHSKRILRTLKDIEQELADARCAKRQTVTLNVYSASKLLPELVMKFKHEHPSIRLKIVHEDLIEDHEYDLGVSSSIDTPSSDCSATLIREDILLALPETHPLSGKESIDLSEVADEEFICLQRGHSLRKITDTYCRLVGFEPTVVLESDSPEIVRGLVQAGIGISFIPSITWKGMCTENIVLLPIKNPECKRYITLFWHENGYLSGAAKVLREFILDYFKTAI